MAGSDDWKLRDAAAGLRLLADRLGADDTHRRIVLEELFRQLAERAREVVRPARPGDVGVLPDEELPPFGRPG